MTPGKKFGILYFNITCGQGDECSCRLIPDGRTLGVEKIVNASDEPGSLLRIGQTHLIDELYDDELQNVAKVADLLNARAQIVESPVLISMDQHPERKKHSMLFNGRKYFTF